jgi:(p)ppGpp synthase/HD superfamily hydrolase
MERIAQTNLQLYNQLRLEGRSPDDLGLIRRCYELSVALYSGSFQGDGKPFVAHTIGVASIMGQLGVSSIVVGAACAHNIYGNGNFGDGRREIASPRRRRFVSDAVGDEVEACIYRFRSFRLDSKSIGEIASRLDQLNARDRDLVTMDLADHLEKYVDYGVLYFGDGTWVTDFVENHRKVLIEIANRLGHPQLAIALAEAIDETARQTIPPELKREERHTAIELVMPQSCMRRPRVVAIERLAQVKRSIFHR